MVVVFEREEGSFGCLNPTAAVELFDMSGPEPQFAIDIDGISTNNRTVSWPVDVGHEGCLAGRIRPPKHAAAPRSSFLEFVIQGCRLHPGFQRT